MVGWPPDDYTLRELYWALIGHRKDAWDQTSEILAMIRAHGGDKKADPAVYHPYREGGRRGGTWADIFGAGRKIVADRERRANRGE